MMHHAVHKVVKRMGGQTSKACGARGVRGVCTFLVAKNAPKYGSVLNLILAAPNARISVRQATANGQFQ